MAKFLGLRQDDDKIGGEILRIVRAKMLGFGYEAGKKQPEFWENARARLVVVARRMAWAWPERWRK